MATYTLFSSSDPQATDTAGGDLPSGSVRIADSLRGGSEPKTLTILCYGNYAGNARVRLQFSADDENWADHEDGFEFNSDELKTYDVHAGIFMRAFVRRGNSNTDLTLVVID